MLTYLNITNYAIVSECEFDLQPGFTAISGETGAGKSITIDALNYCLGARADSKVIRPGTDRCTISAHFDINGLPEAQTWLQDHDLNDGQDCLLRRTIHRDGHSRSYINGQPVSLQVTRELARHLVHIHGQHQNQQLLNRDGQRILLDAYGELRSTLNQVQENFQQWQAAKRELADLIAAHGNAEKKELLSYQFQEFNELALQPDELESLETAQATLANAENILSECEQVRLAISSSEDASASSQLSCALQALGLIPKTKAIQTMHDCLEQALIQISEAERELDHVLSSVELNPEELSRIDSRLERIYAMARKHRVNPEALCQVHQQLETQLNQLNNSEQRVIDLEALIEQREKEYLVNANKLTKKRQSAAKKLVAGVKKLLPDLGLEHGQFKIEVNSDKLSPKSYGLDNIEFLITTNPGIPFGPLNKVASGGELSRVALAIQVVTASVLDVPTLLFDEVDVGIGGNTAAQVGQLLKQLSARAQILCVTHQPQVASYADQHVFISKKTRGDLTESQLKVLSATDRVEEIARMLGGIKITDQTRAHAKELLAQA